MAIASASAARPDCADEIKIQVEQTYYPDKGKDYSKDTRLLNAAGQPPTAEAKRYLKIAGKTTPSGNATPKHKKGRN